jgi:hypothetical protein
MPRTKKKAAPKLSGLRLPPPEPVVRRERKALVVFSDEEWEAVETVAESREEPVSTCIRVLAIAAAEAVRSRTRKP